MAIYKGTNAVALNGANGRNGTDGANGLSSGCASVSHFNAIINTVEGDSWPEGSTQTNTVSGSYNVVGGRYNQCLASEGNSVYGYENKLTHASQGCHTEGMWNWLKASQGAHMEGYSNAVEGGLGCHIEGYGNKDVDAQYNVAPIRLTNEGCHLEGFNHKGIGARQIANGAHIGGQNLTSSSTLSGTNSFYTGTVQEIIGGTTAVGRQGTQGGAVRLMDEHGNMAVAGNFGCWIHAGTVNERFITIEDLYDMIEAINPPV